MLVVIYGFWLSNFQNTLGSLIFKFLTLLTRSSLMISFVFLLYFSFFDSLLIRCFSLMSSAVWYRFSLFLVLINNCLFTLHCVLNEGTWACCNDFWFLIPRISFLRQSRFSARFWNTSLMLITMESVCLIQMATNCFTMYGTDMPVAKQNTYFRVRLLSAIFLASKSMDSSLPLQMDRSMDTRFLTLASPLVE